MKRTIKLSTLAAENLERLIGLLNERAEAMKTGTAWADPSEAVGVAIARWTEQLEEQRKYWKTDAVMPA